MTRSESIEVGEKKEADKPKEESTSSAIGLVKAFISIIDSASGDSSKVKLQIHFTNLGTCSKIT